MLSLPILPRTKLTKLAKGFRVLHAVTNIARSSNQSARKCTSAHPTMWESFHKCSHVSGSRIQPSNFVQARDVPPSRVRAPLPTPKEKNGKRRRFATAAASYGMLRTRNGYSTSTCSSVLGKEVSRGKSQRILLAGHGAHHFVPLRLRPLPSSH